MSPSGRVFPAWLTLFEATLRLATGISRLPPKLFISNMWPLNVIVARKVATVTQTDPVSAEYEEFEH